MQVVKWSLVIALGVCRAWFQTDTGSDDVERRLDDGDPLDQNLDLEDPKEKYKPLRCTSEAQSINGMGMRRFECIEANGHYCNMMVLDDFLGQKEQMDYNPKDKKRFQMCPNRKDFCCTVPEIMSMYGRFKRGKRDLDLINEYHNFFYQNFRMNNPKRIKKLITSWKGPAAKAKMSAEIYARIESDIDYINDRMERINLSFMVVKDFLLRFYGGLICNLCAPRSSNAFRITSVTAQEKALEVAFSLTTFRELINVNTYFMYYLKFLSKLLNVVELYLHYIGDNIPKRVLQQEDFYQKELVMYVGCKKLLNETDMARNVDQAVKKCRAAFKLITNLREAEGLTDIYQTLQRAHDYLSNSFPVQFYQIADQKRMVTPVFFEIPEAQRMNKLVTFKEYKPLVKRFEKAEGKGEKTGLIKEDVSALEAKRENEQSIDISTTGMNDELIFDGAGVPGGVLWLLGLLALIFN